MTPLAKDNELARRMGLSYGQFKALPVVVHSHADSRREIPKEQQAERPKRERRKKRLFLTLCRLIGCAITAGIRFQMKHIIPKYIAVTNAGTTHTQRENA